MSSTRILHVIGIFALLFAFVLPGAADAQQEETAKTPTVVLDTSGFWRIHHSLRSPVVRKGDKVVALQSICKTAAPDSDWRKADFDDSGWARLPGAPFPDISSVWSQVSQAHTGFIACDDSSTCLAQLSLRGKFHVTDPAAVDNLRVLVDFRGGAAVFINGTEVVREALPKAAASPDDLADDYPIEAFVKPDGEPLTGSRDKHPPEVVERWALRTRSIDEVVIPARLLRKGANVLAIEVHRAAYPAQMPDIVEKMGKHHEVMPLWSTCGLTRVQLLADAATGLEPNAVRPSGLQIWNSNLASNDFDLDWGDRTESLRPISIVGTRGGAFSGKVVLGDDKAITALKAQMSDLQGPGGARIPAANVQVRWALPNAGEDGATGRYPGNPSMFDALVETAPEDVAVREKPDRGRGIWNRPNQPTPVAGAVQPVWVTVNVPRDAKAGEYRGTLSISLDGRDQQRVPVELKVNDFVLPPASQRSTVVDFIQSPDSVAMHYAVEPWSQKHWQLLGESFERLGELGNWSVYVPLILHNNQGHKQTMVRWVRQADGSYKHDLSVMEKYLDLAIEKMGKPRIVVLYAHEPFLNGDTAVPVTAVDADGKVSEIELPPYNDPASLKLWQGLGQQVMAALRKRGLEDAAVIGLVPDSAPSKEIVALMGKVFPDVPWMRHAHSSRTNLQGAPIKWQCLVWTPRFAVAHEDFHRGWSEDKSFIQFCRSRSVYPSIITRLLGEINIQGHQRGFGRVGLDFWPVLTDSRGRKIGTLHASDPRSDWRNLDWMTNALLAPGPDGAMASTRLELMREGLQECEARIFLERALADDASRTRLGSDLAQKCEELLVARNHALMTALDTHKLCGFGPSGLSNHSWWSGPGQVGRMWWLGSGWQQRSDELYSTAGEVAAKLNGR
jgi:hypothetical protein